jgi:transposase
MAVYTICFTPSNLTLAASTIASIYEERWQMELFFKALKQSLKLKTFVGTSENAVHSQIWTALIAILLINYLQIKSHLRLEPVQSGGTATAAPVRLSRSVPVVQRTAPGATGASVNPR